MAISPFRVLLFKLLVVFPCNQCPSLPCSRPTRGWVCSLVRKVIVQELAEERRPYALGGGGHFARRARGHFFASAPAVRSQGPQLIRASLDGWALFSARPAWAIEQQEKATDSGPSGRHLMVKGG